MSRGKETFYILTIDVALGKKDDTTSNKSYIRAIVPTYAFELSLRQKAAISSTPVKIYVQKSGHLVPFL